ncbi:hypothetical protein MKW94_010197, partial [Papaver nudicaule]|nr:hypothetical protein [Papaver nudicaule]
KFLKTRVLLVSTTTEPLLQCGSSDQCRNARQVLPLLRGSLIQLCNLHYSVVCCDSKQDLRLQKAFQAMNISDPCCASVYKSILCANCDMFSADLFKIESGTRTVPVLCTTSTDSTKSKGPANDLCSKVWDSCQSEPVVDSPFLQSVTRSATDITSVDSTSSKLNDHWQSKSGFCKDFGKSSEDGEICYDGKSSSLQKKEAHPQPISGICLKKVANGSYLDMVSYPDGSNRIFLGSLQGKIWLATVPEEGSGEELLGFMSMAFHPNFASNGRFFVSYNCDKIQWSGCSGKCSCNTKVNCDPSKLRSPNGAFPCQYHSATRVEPLEVRRIFTMGIAFRGAHGGQILFGPDGYLYFMTGDDESETDSYNFGQNKKSLLGKIPRFDVENIPSATEISKLDLYGNYSIPKDNPYSDDKELRPKIWALGFRNPWHCSFDSERSSYFVCGDAGQDQYEEVDIVTRGGNYGWPFYEGAFPYHHLNTSGNKYMMTSTYFISPTIGYNHSIANTNYGSASITCGFFYRSKTDPCLYGNCNMGGTEDPENSGNFTTSKLPYSCAHNSPIQCNVFFLTGSSVLRVGRPSRCNYACIKKNYTTSENPRQESPASSSNNRVPLLKLLLSLILSL